ncbi:MAG: hypothetical protein QF471_01885 [Phycisphaerales bacterium]|jgi:hypothetical protein|nr:hypothetical protein [Phycisphaerales bacterium]
MRSNLTTFVVLAAITLQGVFGSLQGSVVICLGGGHEHQPAEVVEHCELECSHHSEWPTPTTSDEHIDNCGCTDFELGLIVLLATPSNGEHEFDIAPPSSAITPIAYTITSIATPRGPPPASLDDPGGRQRIAAIRSTRLLI